MTFVKSTSGIETITPEIAAALLARNPSNRKISESLVAQICRDLTGGQWKYNGASIVISPLGELLDGQHRLTAVVRTGIPIVTTVARGVEFEARSTIDTGRARTTAHVLAMHGYTNTTILGAACKVAMAALDNRLHTTFRYQTSQVLAFAQENPDIQKWVADSGALTKLRLLTQSGWAGIGYRASLISLPLARQLFVDGLIHGVFPRATSDPAYHLRERLLRSKSEFPYSGRDTRGVKYPDYVALAKTWNYLREGREIQELRILTRDLVPDNFPGWR